MMMALLQNAQGPGKHARVLVLGQCCWLMSSHKSSQALDLSLDFTAAL